MWKKLKEKWNIESDLQLVWICVIFAITGSTIVWVRKPVQVFLFNEVEFWELVWYQKLAITLIIYFVYQLHLFVIGSVLGQHRFVKWFVIKMNRRMFGRFIKEKNGEISST